MQKSFINLAEQGWLPDQVIRLAIRRLLRNRLRQTETSPAATTREFARRMQDAPIAVAASDANSQHYEVPAEFFQRVLGKHLKYSCGFWAKDCDNLDLAEKAMLTLTCERAELEDGMKILELGCGWGSLSLLMAERFSSSRIVAISNSHSQRQFIETQSRERGLRNLEVLTRNVAEFEISDRFDRLVSVEMFEHVRNHTKLLERISKWLAPHGKLFVHIFCHRDRAYAFEDNGPGDWMARHFFTGGIMPSADLLSEYSNDLAISRQWQVNGLHYARTCEAWLSRLDNDRDRLLELLAEDCDLRTATIRLQRWRMFFLSCAELFAYGGGEEWFVSHYLFEHAAADRPRVKVHLLQA